MFVSLGVLILLSSLGLAIGVGTGATAAGVWGAISVIIGFLVGGWFTGRTLDALDSLVAAAHGILVWAVALVLTLIFAVVTTFLGISSLSSGAHLPYIANILGPLGYTATAPSAATTAATAVASSWITFLVLLLSLIGAAVGAVIGNQVRVTRTQGR